MGRLPKVDEDLKKGPWTPDEDEKLMDYITNNGHTNWQLIPKRAGLNRCGKSCRLRWTNYLRPDIKRGAFSIEEEEIIINLHSLLGNKWSKIAAHLPGRTDNEIKNFYNTHPRKKLLRLGIDPRTHKLIFDINLLLNLSRQFTSNHNNHLMNNPLVSALRLQAQVTEIAKFQQLLQCLFAAINTNNLFPSNFQENFTTSSSHVMTNVGTNTQFLDSFLVNSGTFQKLDNSTNSCISNSLELSYHQGELNSNVDNFEGLSNNSNTHSDYNSLPSLIATSSPEADAHVINQDYDPNTLSQLDIAAWEKHHEGIDDANSSFWNDIFQ